MAAETGFRGDSPGTAAPLGPRLAGRCWVLLHPGSPCHPRVSAVWHVCPYCLPHGCSCHGEAGPLAGCSLGLAPGDRCPASPTGLAWRSDPVTHCIIGFPWTPRREARDSKGGRVPVMAPHALTTFYGCLSIFNERKPISYKLITKNIIRVISLQQINQQDANYRWSFGLELIY